MDPLRELLARRRAELQDRWERQLLHFTSLALERRFRNPGSSADPREAAARRAAVQASLLGDFVYDAALEEADALPETEKRRLSDALAHAAVEVQVRSALDRTASAATATRTGTTASATRCATR